MKVILKKQKVSKKFGVVFPAGKPLNYDDNLAMIEHPFKKGVWIKAKASEFTVYKSEEELAREVLRKAGYFVDNLWTVDDVKSKFNCTDEEAQEVLNGALTNEATMEQIWFAIEVHGEDAGLEAIEEEA